MTQTSSAPHTAEATAATPEPRLAEWISKQGRSVLREMVSVVAKPGVLSLAGGLPAVELFPAEGFRSAMSEALSDPRAMQYGMEHAPLVEQVVDLMRLRGVDCDVRQVVVTTGAQQGIDISARMLVDPGGEVALETISYTGAHQGVAPMQPRVVAVPSDLDAGLDVDALEARLDEGARPSMLYVVPDAHNPLGVSLAPERRSRLVQLAERFDFFVVEDDPYGLLWLDRPFAPPLYAHDSERVIYLGSFSKIIAPGLRLGWMVLPQRLVEKAQIVKDGIDLECSAFVQRAVARFLADADFEAHLEILRRTYGARRDALIAALEQHFGSDARWSRPGGGMFAWVELDPSVDAEALLGQTMARENVAFIPGHAFAVDGQSGRHGLRLSFSTLEPEAIERAVAAIARCLRDREAEG